MWVFVIMITLVIGLIIQGVLMPNEAGLILACFVSVIIIGGYIMYQLRKIQKKQDTIMAVLNKDSTDTNASVPKES